MEILANASGYQTAFKVPEGRHVVDTGVNPWLRELISKQKVFYKTHKNPSLCFRCGFQ